MARETYEVIAPEVELELSAEAPELTPSLPPTDKGSNAWLFLAVCVVVEALLWGNLDTAKAAERSR